VRYSPPADAQPQINPGETRYSKSAGGEYLTLVTTPYYFGQASNRYVGMGYWQKNALSGGIQSTQFTSFTYGLDTPEAGMPRNGAAHWATDIFGLLTGPNTELRTVQGSGSFDIDFASGSFSSFANLDEHDFITGGGLAGSLRFQAGGQDTNGNGFSGNFSYDGGRGLLGGALSGKFYGPGAEELGATFNAASPYGVLTGAMTGQRSVATAPPAQTLLNVPQSQRVRAYDASFFTQVREGERGYADVKAGGGDGFVVINPSGAAELQVGGYSYTPVTADLVTSSRANFTAYQGNVAGRPVRVEYYKVGSANTELALTYTSFATWSEVAADMSSNGQKITNSYVHQLLYGIETPRDLLIARTGSASYSGVVYGRGASLEGALWDVGGTSRFNVDFSASRYTGSLSLNGRAADGRTTNFGDWAFASTLGFGQLGRASFDNGANADPFHTIDPRFFGPDGQEIGATFNLSTGPDSDARTVRIAGVAVAKRQ
jgi:hypothetical protein